MAKMLDQYVKELVEKTPERPQRTMPIYVTPFILQSINDHRIQYARHREPQHKALERIIKFYNAHHPPICGNVDGVTNTPGA